MSASDSYPPLVLGCANFGGIGSLPELIGQGEAQEVAFALMDAAWVGGIRWFDTADAYGGGRSEQWIGDWIRVRGHQPQITTKTYNAMPPLYDVGLSPERILRQVESSLQRLNVDKLDLYLAHEFDSARPLGRAVETLQQLCDEQVITAYGVSNFSAEQLGETLRFGTPSVIQNSYSLFDRKDENDVIPLAVASNVAYQAYSPLAGGWLSGKYRRGAAIPSDSRVGLVPQWYQHIDPANALSALERLEQLANARSATVPSIALSWVCAQPGVSSVIIGPRKPHHLDVVWEATQLILSPHDLELTGSFF